MNLKTVLTLSRRMERISDAITDRNEGGVEGQVDLAIEALRKWKNEDVSLQGRKAVISELKNVRDGEDWGYIERHFEKAHSQFEDMLDVPVKQEPEKWYYLAMDNLFSVKARSKEDAIEEFYRQLAEGELSKGNIHVKVVNAKSEE